MHFPAAGSTWKRHLKRAVAFGVKTIRQTEVGRALTHQPLRGLSKQFLTGAIYQTKLVVAVERKNSDLDFRHNGSQKRGSFQGAKTLFAKNLPKKIYLEHRLAEGIVTRRASSTNRKVAFSKRR